MVSFRTSHLIAALFLLLALGLWLRSVGVTASNYFYESDNYVYYSAIIQAIQNNYIAPTTLAFCGFAPNNCPYSESAGLLYFTLIPYYFLSGFSVYNAFTPLIVITFMYSVVMYFGLLEIIGTFILAKLVYDNDYFALLSAFIVAVFPAAVYRTSAGQYRGESFVPVILLYAIIFLLLAFKDRKRVYINSFAAAVAFLICIYSWLAGAYVIAVFVLLTIGIALYDYLKLPLTITALFFLSAIGWLLLPFILPYLPAIFGAYFNNTSSYLATTLEYAAPNLVTMFVLFNLTLVAAPAGIILYTLQFKGKDLNAYAFLSLIATFLVGGLLLIHYIRWFALIPIPIAIFSAYSILMVIQYLKNRVNTIMAYAIAGMLIGGIFIISTNVIFGIKPLGNQNSNFYAALAFLKDNTSSNSTVLTFWQDGSLVEGLSQRQSYTDSVEKGQNETRIENFASFMLAQEGNFSYLSQIKPNYLLIRQDYINYTWAFRASSMNTPHYNTTNLDILLAGYYGSSNGIRLYPVYKNADSTIYKVEQAPG